MANLKLTISYEGYEKPTEVPKTGKIILVCKWLTMLDLQKALTLLMIERQNHKSHITNITLEETTEKLQVLENIKEIFEEKTEQAERV